MNEQQLRNSILMDSRIARACGRDITAPASCSELSKIMDVNSAMKRDAASRLKLQQIRDSLIRISDEIAESVRVEFSNDFVLLKRNGEKWQFVGIFNPNTWEGEQPEWDLCIPIPHTETVPEFQGW